VRSRRSGDGHLGRALRRERGKRSSREELVAAELTFVMALWRAKLGGRDDLERIYPWR
jgi:hypothetical protein